MVKALQKGNSVEQIIQKGLLELLLYIVPTGSGEPSEIKEEVMDQTKNNKQQPDERSAA